MWSPYTDVGCFAHVLSHDYGGEHRMSEDILTKMCGMLKKLVDVWMRSTANNRSLSSSEYPRYSYPCAIDHRSDSPPGRCS